MYNDQQSRTITVFGEGVVKVSPDTINMAFSVITRGAELAPIQQENAARMNRVIESLKKAGLTESSIQTSDFQIRPVYEYVNGEQPFTGYEVINSIRVTIDEIAQTGALVDLAVKNGANQVGTVEFAVRDRDRPYQQALTLAMRDADAKMIAIGTSMALQNKPIPMKVEEQHANQPIQFRALAMADTLTPIEPGAMTIGASVLVKYQIV